MGQKRLSWLLVLLIFSACGSEEPSPVCKPISARSGYVTNGILTFDLEYQYHFEGDRLIEVKKLRFDSKELESTTSYEYDSDGRNVKEVTRYPNGSNFVDYVYHQYAPKTLTTTSYLLNGMDTVSFNEVKSHYAAEGKAIQRAQFSNISLNVVDDNVVGYGYYTVDGSDTTDIFVEEYSFDKNRNYYLDLPYRVVIPSDFAWAKLNSKNNLVHAEYVGGAWTKSYTYEYDNAGRLVRHVGAAGITVEFEYSCD